MRQAWPLCRPSTGAPAACACAKRRPWPPALGALGGHHSCICLALRNAVGPEACTFTTCPRHSPLRACKCSACSAPHRQASASGLESLHLALGMRASRLSRLASGGCRDPCAWSPGRPLVRSLRQCWLLRCSGALQSECRGWRVQGRPAGLLRGLSWDCRQGLTRAGHLRSCASHRIDVARCRALHAWGSLRAATPPSAAGADHTGADQHAADSRAAAQPSADSDPAGERQHSSQSASTSQPATPSWQRKSGPFRARPGFRPRQRDGRAQLLQQQRSFASARCAHGGLQRLPPCASGYLRHAWHRHCLEALGCPRQCEDRDEDLGWDDDDADSSADVQVLAW